MLERMTPRPEQAAASELLLADHKHICRAQVGAGKTLVAVEAALRAGVQRTLVTGPLNTRSGWQSTFARQGSELPFHHIKTLKDTDKDLGALMNGEPGHYFLGWQLFARYPMWGNFPIDFAVFDEVHRAQSRKSANHKAMSSVQAEYQVGLSATPWGNHISGAWAPLNCLWPERYPYYWPFVGEFLSKERNAHAERKSGQVSFVAGDERVPGSVWASIPSKSDFPSPYTEQPTLHSVEVGLTPVQRKLYERFEKESAVWLAEHLLAADLPAVQYLRLMEILLAVPNIREDWIRVQDKDTGDWHKEWGEVVYYEDDAKSSKIDAALEVLSDEVPEHEPVLMFTHSRKFATLLTKRLQRLGLDARQFVGGMTADERAWKLEAFGKEYRIMVATIPTVGEGTDGLQDLANYEFWFSVSDNRILNEQARGRLSRPGQRRRVQRYTFFAEDTIETSRQLPRLERDQLVLDASFPARQAA